MGANYSEAIRLAVSCIFAKSCYDRLASAIASLIQGGLQLQLAIGLGLDTQLLDFHPAFGQTAQPAGQHGKIFVASGHLHLLIGAGLGQHQPLCGRSLLHLLTERQEGLLVHINASGVGLHPQQQGLLLTGRLPGFDRLVVQQPQPPAQQQDRQKQPQHQQRPAITGRQHLQTLQVRGPALCQPVVEACPCHLQLHPDHASDVAACRVDGTQLDFEALLPQQATQAFQLGRAARPELDFHAAILIAQQLCGQARLLQ